MAQLIAALVMTLSVLEGHFLSHAFSNACLWRVVRSLCIPAELRVL